MKDKNKTLNGEVFGSLKKYKLYALKSIRDLIPFTASFEQIIHHQFYFLTNFIVNPEKYDAHYIVMYAMLSRDVHCCIMENKSVVYNNSESLTSNKEKKLPFQTLSLFEDILYLFNKDGFTIYKADMKDYDYLLFIFADKEKVINHYVEPFENNHLLKTVDLSYLVEKDADKKNNPQFQFLKNTFSNFEVLISKFHQNQLNQILGEKNKILNQNFIVPLKVAIDREITQNLTQNVNDEYIRFLTQEVDSL
jgi:hypothetical protein